jgi:hypothetical protein
MNAQYYLRANPEYNDIKQLEILGKYVYCIGGGRRVS